MVYPANFLRVAMSGTTYPDEGWSCSLNLGQNFDGPLTQPANLTPYVDACKAWFARADTGISSLCKLTMVKVNLIGTNGQYVSSSSAGTVEITPVVSGGGGAVPCVPQDTQALTLTTNRTRGLAVRGRIYPPMITGTVAADGLITVANSLARANSLAVLINALNAIGPGDVAIMSNVAAGHSEIVRGVRAGRVMDTQRRRRRSLKELPVLATTAIVVPSP